MEFETINYNQKLLVKSPLKVEIEQLYPFTKFSDFPEFVGFGLENRRRRRRRRKWDFQLCESAQMGFSGFRVSE